MDVILPQSIAKVGFDPSMGELLSSSIADSTETAWSTSTAYSINQMVKFVIPEGAEKGITKIFKCKNAHTSGTTDNPYVNTNNWSDQGPTNKWAMFDSLALTTSTDTNSSIVVNLRCRSINSIAFMNVQASQIMVKVYSGHTLAHKRPENLLSSQTYILTQQLINWSEYFFKDFDYIRDIANPIDIDLYHNVVVEITFVKMSGEDCYIGQCLPGRTYDIGNIRYGISSGIKDYSKKTTDSDFGYTYLKQGNYKKLLDCDITVQNDQVNQVNSILTQLRAVPTVWQGNPSGMEYDNWLVYGFYKNFKIIRRKRMFCECSLEIEGLI